MSLEPGLPADPHINHINKDKALPRSGTMNRHRLPQRCEIRAKPMLGGLHHEYSLERNAARGNCDEESSNIDYFSVATERSVFTN
jgi:hypothetical protein